MTNPEEEDFATMFEASAGARRFQRGQAVDGTIVAIGSEVALVDIGAKGEAQIDVAELKDADGDIEVSVGDRIQAVVVSTTGGVRLSRKGVRNAATQQQIEDAFRAGLAVDGKVEKVMKGGYEVRIARERAFCPLSQIDVARSEDPAVHEGAPTRSGSSRTRMAARTSWSPGASCSKRSSAPAPPRSGSRSCLGPCSRGAWCRCATSARSSISAAAFRGCCTCRRWDGRG